jgi:hypothetical protein
VVPVLSRIPARAAPALLPAAEPCVSRLSVDSLFLSDRIRINRERRDWALDRGWILDDDDVIKVVESINLRILNDIAKTYHQNEHVNIEVKHKGEPIKNLHQLIEDIHSIERIFNVTFNFTPDLR